MASSSGKPRLGGSFSGAARPGGATSFKGAGGHVAGPKAARPGGVTSLGKGAGKSGGIARPGGPQGISK